MSFVRISFGLLLAAALSVGCSKPVQAPVQQVADPSEPTQAQPPLQTLKLWLGPQEIEAELALNGPQWRSGMMFRTNMAENAGMLFVFPTTHRASFWMKNTYVPLSAAYIDPEGVIREIHDLNPRDTNQVTAATADIQYVLEVNQGWFRRHRVEVGTVLRTEHGSLRETFFGAR